MSTDGDDSNDRTIQMSPEALAKLHAELAGKRVPSARDVKSALSENTLEVEHLDAPPRVNPQAAVKPAVPPRGAALARQEQPVRETSGGGGMLVVGGIGAIIAGLGPATLTLATMQGMFGDRAIIFAAFCALVLGHLLTGLGMFGAVSRTNGVAALVGTFHIISFLGATFVTLAGLEVIDVEPRLAEKVALIVPAVLGATWLLSAIWSFSSTRALGGAVASLHGVFALLGGGAVVTIAIGVMTDMFPRGINDDLGMTLLFAGAGAILLAGIFLAVGKFGRLRSAS